MDWDQFWLDFSQQHRRVTVAPQGAPDKHFDLLSMTKEWVRLP
jgi:hypothetical protein